MVLSFRKPFGIAELIKSDPHNQSEAFDAVIVNTISYVLLINRTNGQLVRKFDFEFVANTPGSSDGGLFYVGSVNGWYHAVRLSEGAETVDNGLPATLSLPRRKSSTAGSMSPARTENSTSSTR